MKKNASLAACAIPSNNFHLSIQQAILTEGEGALIRSEDSVSESLSLSPSEAMLLSCVGVASVEGEGVMG